MAVDARTIGTAQIDASRAAIEVSREANVVMMRQVRLSNKPWLSIELTDTRIESNFKGEVFQHAVMFRDGEVERMVNVFGTLTIHCIGEMPLAIETVDMNLQEYWKWLGDTIITEEPIRPDRDFFTVLPKGAIVKIHPFYGISTAEFTHDQQPFAHVILTPINRVNFITHPPAIIGKVIYSDPFGIRYEHRFAFVATDASWQSVRRYGGIKYNGEKQI